MDSRFRSVRRWWLFGRHLERPAIRRLLADVKAGRVGVIVVYKIDRLSRSMLDFLNLVELFESHGVTFVSVTQSLNTKDAMGRMALNILVTFAQFERELIGERIRDKVAASRKRGKWMGGWTPLGYEVRDRKLLVQDVDAERVRAMFRRFVQLKSATRLARELVAANERTRYGHLLDKGVLYKILNNRVYLGEAVHKGTSYPGEHKPIVDRKLWDQVHAILKESPRKRAGNARAKTPALLKGLLFGPDGAAMSPTHTRKSGRLYRYYISQTAMKQGSSDCPVKLVPAAELANHYRSGSSAAANAGSHCSDLARSAPAILRRQRGRSAERTRRLRRTLERAVSRRTGARCRTARRARRHVCRTDGHHIERQRINLALLGTATEAISAGRRMNRPTTLALGPIGRPKLSRDGRTMVVSIPISFRRQGERKRVVTPANSEAWSAPKPQVDNTLIKAVVRAHPWRNMLESNLFSSVRELAKTEKINESYLCRELRLTLLAPAITEAILNGLQPNGLELAQLLRLIPAEWEEQQVLFSSSVPKAGSR